MRHAAAQLEGAIGSVVLTGALAAINGIRAARERQEADRVAAGIVRLDAELAVAQSIGAAAEAEVATLRTALVSARTQVVALEEEIDDLLDEIAALRAENARLRAAR